MNVKQSCGTNIEKFFAAFETSADGDAIFPKCLLMKPGHQSGWTGSEKIGGGGGTNILMFSLELGKC